MSTKMCSGSAMKRNRNVRSKIDMENHCDNKGESCFGEPVLENVNDQLFERRFDWGSDGNGWMTKSVSFDKSSSSTLSWGDDCEQEATQQVKIEYDRMVRVLQGHEMIPPNYDSDEYKLWIRTFPSLRSSIKLNDQNCRSRKRSYPTTPMSSRLPKDSEAIPDLSMIDDLINKFSINLTIPNPERKVQNYPRKPLRTSREKKTHFQKSESSNMLERDFESLLRISPAPTLNKSVSFEARNSSRSVRNVVNCDDFNSLPFLTPKIEAKTVVTKKTRRKAKNSLVLPPIEVTFRSVSALPLQGKCLSAMSSVSNLNFEVKSNTLLTNYRDRGPRRLHFN